MSTLGPATAYDAPWPLFTFDEALPTADLLQLRAAFDGVRSWDRYESFYRCDMADITAAVPPALGEALAEEVAALTGEPLLRRARFTAQRMHPGDHALPHTDRPLLGFEAVRLVISLNEGWTPDDLGQFIAHPPEEPEPTLTRAPVGNSAVCFVMTPASLHEVRPTSRERHTVVAHFWHVANPPDLADWLHEQLEGFHFRSLPAVLGPRIDAADAAGDLDAAHRAACAGWLAARWGLTPEEVAEAFDLALTPSSRGAPGPTLAAWFAALRDGAFVPADWRRLRDTLPSRPADDRLVEPWARALGMR